MKRIIATRWASALVATPVLLAAVSFDFQTISQARAQEAEQPFHQKFWSWLKTSRYKNWAPWPGQEGDFYEGQAPHGAFLKMYVNRDVASHPQDMPHGSVIVKENYSPEKKLKSITVMYRVEGYDSKHNDWYWAKYNPDGSVATTPPDKGSKPIAGKFQSCINCHTGAEGQDFVFTNDEGGQEPASETNQ